MTTIHGILLPCHRQIAFICLIAYNLEIVKV